MHHIYNIVDFSIQFARVLSSHLRLRIILQVHLCFTLRRLDTWQHLPLGFAWKSLVIKISRLVLSKSLTAIIVVIWHLTFIKLIIYLTGWVQKITFLGVVVYPSSDLGAKHFLRLLLVKNIVALIFQLFGIMLRWKTILMSVLHPEVSSLVLLNWRRVQEIGIHGAINRVKIYWSP